MEKNRSILLVHPSLHARDTLRTENFVRFQPLGLAYIAAATPRHWKVRLIDESYENIGNFGNYSIIAVSTNTRTALRAYRLATEAKKDGCYTVAGGIHASMCTKEALRYFDTVIRGEGEKLWQEFLRDYELGSPKRAYQAPSFEDMNSIPFPDRSVMTHDYPVGSIQTSRGCPFNCSFCSVTAFNGKRYRYRSPDLVLGELQEIEQKYVFFVDDNLIGCSRRSIKRTKDIFQGMIDRKIDKLFMAQVTINFGLDEELIDLASRSGCRAVFIGIESIDTNVLISMNKSINIRTGVNRYSGIFQNIRKRGIAVIGTMALGNDGEAPSIFEDTARFIDESGLDAVQLTISTPLPGTRLFKDLSREERIVFADFPDDWVHYSLGSLVFHPRGKSAREVISGWKRLIDNVYSMSGILRRSARTIVHTKKLSSLYLAYKLNKAYRTGYRNSLFYNNPPLERFSRSADQDQREAGIPMAARPAEARHQSIGSTPKT